MPGGVSVPVEPDDLRLEKEKRLLRLLPGLPGVVATSSTAATCRTMGAALELELCSGGDSGIIMSSSGAAEAMMDGSGGDGGTPAVTVPPSGAERSKMSIASLVPVLARM